MNAKQLVLIVVVAVNFSALNASVSDDLMFAVTTYNDEKVRDIVKDSKLTSADLFNALDAASNRHIVSIVEIILNERGNDLMPRDLHKARLDALRNVMRYDVDEDKEIAELLKQTIDKRGLGTGN